MEIIRKSEEDKDRDSGMLTEFFDRWRGVFCVTDGICPCVRQH